MSRVNGDSGREPKNAPRQWVERAKKPKDEVVPGIEPGLAEDDE